jgi:hypothetical protein
MRPVTRAILRSVVLSIALGASTLSAQSGNPRPILEASLWGGYTSFASTPGALSSGGAAQTGLRSAEVSLWPSRRLRVFGRYDNTLSLDNLALIRAGRSVPLYRGGAQFDWGRRFTTIVDAGHRTLPGQITQNMLNAEQVIFLPRNLVAKAGGWIGPRSDSRTEWLGHVALSLPVGARLRLEPTLFIANSGIAGEGQWRGLLNAEAQLAPRLSLGGGAALGRNTGIDPRLTGQARSAYARLSLALTSMQKVHLLLNRESAPGANTITTLAAGLSLGVPRS